MKYQETCFLPFGKLSETDFKSCAKVWSDCFWKQRQLLRLSAGQEEKWLKELVVWTQRLVCQALSVLLPAWERSAAWRCGHLEASRLPDFIYSCPGSIVPSVRGQTCFVWVVIPVLGRCWGEVGDGEHSSGAPETTLQTGLLEQARAVGCWQLHWLEALHHSSKYKAKPFNYSEKTALLTRVSCFTSGIVLLNDSVVVFTPRNLW